MEEGTEVGTIERRIERRTERKTEAASGAATGSDGMTGVMTRVRAKSRAMMTVAVTAQANGGVRMTLWTRHVAMERARETAETMSRRGSGTGGRVTASGTERKRERKRGIGGTATGIAAGMNGTDLEIAIATGETGNRLHLQLLFRTLARTHALGMCMSGI